MKTNYHLLFYALSLLVLAQTMAIALYFSKISNPIHTNLIAELNESTSLYQQDLMKANATAFKDFEKKVAKERRGREYLKIVENVQALVNEKVWHLDSLLEMPQEKSAETAKILAESWELFYNKLNTTINPKNTTHKEDLKILNNWIDDCKDSLSVDALQLNDETLKHHIRQKQVDLLVLSKKIIELFDAKVGSYILHCFYPKYRVAFIPESTVWEQGDTFKAKVYLAKSASMVRPSIQVNGKGLSLDKDGFATYKTKAHTLGKQTIEGFIAFYDDKTNQKDTLAFEIDYEVIEKCK